MAEARRRWSRTTIELKESAVREVLQHCPRGLIQTELGADGHRHIIWTQHNGMVAAVWDERCKILRYLGYA